MDTGRTDPDRELAEAKITDAVEARRQQRRRRELQIEESTLQGVLFGLADMGQTVVVVGTAGRRTTGVVADVGLDLALIETSGGFTVGIRIESVVAIESSGAGPGGSGVQQREPSPRTMADLAADLVGTGLAANLHLEGDVHLDGEVLGVGQDLVIVRVGDSQTVYVALDSLNELAWSTSVG